jgi:transglutaminase-like putative cysteine protease
VGETRRDITPASAALVRGAGLSHDFAHLFIACARVLQIPARCVSGYCLRGDAPEPSSGHVWAEAWVKDLGWVGFDPTHGVSPCETYLRVAAAPDYLGAAPLRDANSGGTGERVVTRIHVDGASRPETASRQSFCNPESHAGPTPRRS